MAESLLSIKTRLASVRSIGKMTKAMKLIAAARYTRWKNLLDGNKTYEQAMREALLLCLQRVDFTSENIPNCMIKNEKGRKLYIFISSSLGLCGAYNHDLFKVFDQTVTSEDDVIFIGERGYRHFQNRPHKSYRNYLHITQYLTYDSANEFRHWLDKLYKNENYQSVFVIYTQYINSINTKVSVKRILPLEREDIPPVKTDSLEPTFDPNAASVANLLVPHYLDAILYRILLESNVSEQTSRRNSMDNATNSADKITHQLILTFNKLRQQKITQEITEVVGGANANN